MTDIIIERTHALGLDQALDQIQTLAERLASELDADCDWNGTRLEFTRAGAAGSVEVTETLLILEVRLSFLLLPFKGRIEQSITDQLDGLIPCCPPA